MLKSTIIVRWWEPRHVLFIPGPGRLGLPIERDVHFIPDKPISAYAEEARAKGRIIT